MEAVVILERKMYEDPKVQCESETHMIEQLPTHD